VTGAGTGSCCTKGKFLQIAKMQNTIFPTGCIDLFQICTESETNTESNLDPGIHVLEIPPPPQSGKHQHMSLRGLDEKREEK
jgi:hypothetical protein